MVNGHDRIYVERDGKLSLSPLRFTSEQHLRRAIERIVGRVGRRIDESSPMVDARLPTARASTRSSRRWRCKGSSLDDPQVRRRRRSPSTT